MVQIKKRINKPDFNNIRYKIKKNENKFLAIAILAAVIIIGIVIMAKSEIFRSEKAMEEFVESKGVMGPLFMILINITQCIFPVIPGGIGFAVSATIFGPSKGFVCNYVGNIIGATLAFLITRDSGKKILSRILKRETYYKYLTYVNNSQAFEKFFAIAIFLPGFPDDILCYIAGLSGIPFKRYMLIILLGKIPNIVVYSFGGAAIGEFLQKIF